ncbi:uroporphyrinogen-III synthase [Robertmurraya korlensis]|uniref:uroporphyrinogen-III synthase n=1 Tax=Robertmurraya korlensis TaxID=519977 RepID=UPI000824B243|nr:uroporphyrinogen-III synthase [Robertmurraya korlensis]
MKKLENKRVVIAGTRKTDEISKIISNQGGIPLLRPSQGTARLDDSNIEGEISKLLAGSYEWLIFTTGIGLTILLETAESMKRKDEFIAKLKESKIAARGYKTVNVLKTLGITPIVRDDDGSTAGLVRSLSVCEQFGRGARVALQLHGDPAPLLIKFLEKNEATFHEILPYIHTPPSEEIIDLLLSEIIEGSIDAVSFTSTPQVRFLFAHADKKGQTATLLNQFENKVVALAVGKVTAQSLKEHGVHRVIFPETERMGSAIICLADYYSK